MNTKFSLTRFIGALGFTLLTAALAACTPLTRYVNGTPNAPHPTPISEFTPAVPDAAGLREVLVENVQVQVGVGSPIPVDVLVSGTWPDLCAQLAEAKQHMENGRIDITLLATPAEPNCPPDHVGVPFRIAIPLNVVELPAGMYTVIVNDVSATFRWPAPSSAGAGPASIGGWVWHDLCDSGQEDQPAPATAPPGCIGVQDFGYRANGAKEFGEPALVGVLVKLGAGACPSTGLAETYTGAGETGYLFTGLSAGTYCVSVDAMNESNASLLFPGAWSYPETQFPQVTLSLNAGESKTEVNFGWDFQFLPAPEAGGQIAPGTRLTGVKYVQAVTDAPVYAGKYGDTRTLVNTIPAGRTAMVTGVSEDHKWWRVLCPGDQVGQCWASALAQYTQPHPIGPGTQIAPGVLETAVQYVMVAADVPVYGGEPGDMRMLVNTLTGGQTAMVTGVSADGKWWRVLCPGEKVGYCWASASAQLTYPLTAPDF